MRSASALSVALAAAVVAAGCGSSSSTSKSTAASCDPLPANTSAFQVSTGPNVVSIAVSSCGAGLQPYINEPCVSVKVCNPGTSTCKTIDGLLLDTGSYGLRVFKEALTGLSLPSVAAPGGGSLAECIHYADLSADWGPVVSADVVVGGEPAVTVPMQIIDATFGTLPAGCTGPETFTNPSFNGILGVGPLRYDCLDTTCPAAANRYYASSGATTTGVAVPPSSQVQNPIAALAGDGNGIIIQLPSVPPAGAPTATGSLVLGIGTRTNNVPVGARGIPLDSGGDFTTTLNGVQMANSFIDSGSNGYFFDPPTGISIPRCTGALTSWYCPATCVAYSATNSPTSGPGASIPTSFQVGNTDALTASGVNGAIPALGGPGVVGGGFDWGFPFFLGRTVYIVYQGGSSSLGAGPLVAY